MLQIVRTHNIGFCASWADGISLNICATILLQFQQDVTNLAIDQNIKNITKLNFGYRQMEFYFPTCTKPRSLAAILNDHHEIHKKSIWTEYKE